MRHIVMFSGGVGSWATAKRVARHHGTDNLTLLFADTLMEDQDLYRFLREAATNVGGQLVTVADGRDPWQVFKDERFLGNARIDPCSRVLKRELLRRWLEDNCDPEDTTVYLGIDWTEGHRFTTALPRWAPWKCEAPLMEEPLIMKEMLHHQLAEEGLIIPRLYSMGFPHNNCGGFCIKAGQAHFKHLLEVLPDVYAFHEQKEAELSQYLDKKVTILVDRKGGGRRKPLSLREFRERIQANGPYDEYEWGGCGCVA